MNPAHHHPGLPARQASLDRLRGRLGTLRATRWLIGGADEDTTLSLRQGLIGSVMIMVGSWGVGWLASTPTSLFARTTILNPLRVEPVHTSPHGMIRPVLASPYDVQPEHATYGDAPPPGLACPRRPSAAASSRSATPFWRSS